jgi:hypothetical protein
MHNTTPQRPHSQPDGGTTDHNLGCSTIHFIIFSRIPLTLCHVQEVHSGLLLVVHFQKAVNAPIVIMMMRTIEYSFDCRSASLLSGPRLAPLIFGSSILGSGRPANASGARDRDNSSLP